MLLFDVRLPLTKEQILDGLRRSGLRRATKGRLIAQTAALLFVAVWSVIGFIGGGETMSLVIAAAALILIAVMLLVPAWKMRSIAAEAASDENGAHLWVFEDGVDFGEDPPDKPYFPYASFYCDHPQDKAPFQTLVFRFGNDDIIIVPKDLLTEEQWQTLCEKTKQRTAVFSRHR